MTLAAPARQTIRIAIGLLGLALIAMPLACSSSKIEVHTGTNLLGPKRVKVGENFTVTQPFDPATGAEWKLGHYDRTLLQPVPRFAYETASDGSMTRIYEFTARAPGRAELTFLRRNREPVTPGVAPPEPEKKIFKLRIVE